MFNRNVHYFKSRATGRYLLTPAGEERLITIAASVALAIVLVLLAQATVNYFRVTALADRCMNTPLSQIDNREECQELWTIK